MDIPAAADAFAEIVPLPERGRVFSAEVRGGLADVGAGGRVRLDAIARWLQDVAYGDVEDAGVAAAGYWVVRRARLRVERFPRFREHVRLQTFCSGLGPLWAERRTVLTGQDGARADATAVWVFVNPESGRPMRVEGPMGDAYAEAAGGRRVTARLRQPPPPQGAAVRAWRFRSSDTDLAGHVNNATYWAAVEELLAEGPEPERLDAELEYRTPAEPGAVTLLSDGPALWIARDDGELHASAIVLAEPASASASPAP